MTFSLVYTNDDILRITKCRALREFIDTQYLKYIARCLNMNLTKLSLFYTPKASYYRDPWINISSLFSDISIEQAKRETQSKTGFSTLTETLLLCKSSDSMRLNISHFEDLSGTVLACIYFTTLRNLREKS